MGYEGLPAGRGKGKEKDGKENQKKKEHERNSTREMPRVFFCMWLLLLLYKKNTQTETRKSYMGIKGDGGKDWAERNGVPGRMAKVNSQYQGMERKRNSNIRVHISKEKPHGQEGSLTATCIK